MIKYKGCRSGSFLWLLSALVLTLSGCGGSAERQARHEKRGQDYLAAGNFDKARIEFRNALQLAPASSRVRYENGLVAEKLANFREAAQFFLGAVDADADNIDARAHLGTLFIAAGLPDKALEYVNPSLAKHPNAVALLTVHAAAVAMKKDRSTALKEAQRAFSIDPNNEDVVSTLAGIESALGQADEAQKLVEDAAKRMPQSVTLRRVLVQVYLTQNNMTGAEQALLGLIHLEPHEKSYRLQLAQLYAKTDRLDEAERTLRTAIAEISPNTDLKTGLVEFLWARRGHDRAETELKQMIAGAPKEYELRFALARFYEQRNDRARAEAEYRDVIAREGKNPYGIQARDHLAELLAQKNDLSGAQKLIDEVLEENPGDNDALVMRANDELAHRRADAAITDLRRVLRDQPNSSDVLVALTKAYAIDGDMQLAEDAARHAVEADPSSIPARLELARALIRGGHFEQGRTLLYALDKQHPDDPVVLDLIYRSSVALNDTASARTAATEMVKIRPDSAIGQLDLGILAESDGHDDEALTDYRKAFELQPHALEPIKALVMFYEHTKRFDDAVTLLDEVTARSPTSPVGPSFKGEVLLAEKNHLPQAEAAFRAAIQRSPKWWAPYKGLAFVEFERGAPTEAAERLKEAIAHVEFTEEQRLELAGLLTNAGESEAAMSQYEMVLKENPKSPIAAGGLALLLASYRTDEVSLSRAQTLVRPLANSNDWRLLDAFGWVHFKNEDIKAALPALERASAERPDASELRFHLGMVQLKAGQADEAEKNLAAAVQTGALFLGRDEAKAILARLRSNHRPS